MRRLRSASPVSHPHRGLASLPGSTRLVFGYYLATPLFALLDFAFGINVRAAFLDGQPVIKLAWYALAFACALVVARWPGRAGLVGLAESGANIALLVIGTMSAYLGAVDSALSESAMEPPLSPADAVNLVVSSAALIVSYIAAQARASREDFDGSGGFGGFGGRRQGRL